MKAIADTGFIVAFGNCNDRHHDWAVGVAQRASAPFLTCEAVLAEAAFHLSSVAYVLTLVSDGLLQVRFDLTENFESLAALARKYRDQQPDLADLCLVRMSELYPRHVIVTVDEHDFRTYRRNKRDVIPVICPPGYA